MHDAQHVANFGRALFTFIKCDKAKFLPQQLIQLRLNVCTICEHFEPLKKNCKICGCGCDSGQTIFNKLAMPSEQCPLHPPKWLKYDGVESIKAALEERST